MAKSAIEISVVIPVFQEHAVIALTLAAVADVLNSLSVTYEIVVVDDGSTDDTFERCAQFRQQNPCIKIVGLSRRFGKAAALVAGMARASGDAIMTLDGDMQHPPVKIPEFIKCWRDGAQVVHGVKVNRYFEGFFHQITARGFNWVMSRTAGFDMAGVSKNSTRRLEESEIRYFREPEDKADATRLQDLFIKQTGQSDCKIIRTSDPDNASGSRKFQVWFGKNKAP